MHTASRLGRFIAFIPSTWCQASALAAPFSAYTWQACSCSSIKGNSMPLPVVPSTFQALSTRSLGHSPSIPPRSSRRVGPPGHRNRLQARLRPQPQRKQHQQVPEQEQQPQQQQQQQQQIHEESAAQQLPHQQEVQRPQRQRRPTFSSPAAAVRHWQQQQQEQAATLPPQHLHQQQQQKHRGISGVSSSSSTPVIAASAASGTEAYPAAADARSSSFPRLPGPASRSRRPTSRLTISLSPVAPVQTQQQQQQQHEMPQWHVFGNSGSGHHEHHHHHHHHHQQQQQQRYQQWQNLQQLPPTSGPIVVDITHLVNLQQQQSADEDSRASSSSSSSYRRRKLTLEQKQLHMLDNINPQQQLFWVTINQPKGGSSPAAVWVKPWPAALSVEALRLSEGPTGQDLVLFEAQARPDVGQRPAVVVEGLRFPFALANSSSSTTTTAAAAAAEVSATTSSSAGDDTSSSSSSSGSSSDGGVYDYLVLCSGEFSPLEHENMFPNAFVHCGDGRQLHQARGAHDVAALVAEPDFQLIEAHCHNLMRYAYDLLLQDKLRCSGPVWVYEKLVARWGADALWHFGVDVRYVNDNLFKVLPQPKLPTVA